MKEMRELVGDTILAKAYGRELDPKRARQIMEQEFVRPALLDAEVMSRVPDESGVEAMTSLAERFRAMIGKDALDESEWQSIEPWIDKKLGEAESRLDRLDQDREPKAWQEAERRHAELLGFRDFLREKVRRGKSRRAA